MCMGQSFRAVAREDNNKGFENDPDIQCDAPPAYILLVQTNDLIKVGNLASSADLPETGQTRGDGKAYLMLRLVFLEFLQCWWARAHNAHGSHKYIESLRELVDAGASQKTSDTGDAWIVFDLKYIAGHLVLLLQVTLAFLCVGVHSAELDYAEYAAIATNTFLGEKYGPPILKKDQRTDKYGQENYENCADKPEEDVNESLDDTLTGGRGVETG